MAYPPMALINILLRIRSHIILIVIRLVTVFIIQIITTNIKKHIYKNMFVETFTKWNILTLQIVQTKS